MLFFMVYFCGFFREHFAALTVVFPKCVDVDVCCTSAGWLTSLD
jgi:hypothetical protein